MILENSNFLPTVSFSFYAESPPKNQNRRWIFDSSLIVEEEYSATFAHSEILLHFVLK